MVAGRPGRLAPRRVSPAGAPPSRLLAALLALALAARDEVREQESPRNENLETTTIAEVREDRDAYQAELLALSGQVEALEGDVGVLVEDEAPIVVRFDEVGAAQVPSEGDQIQAYGRLEVLTEDEAQQLRDRLPEGPVVERALSTGQLVLSAESVSGA